MVTLIGTQNFNEFELHARTVLGIPTTHVAFLKAGASCAILAEEDTTFERDLPLSYVIDVQKKPILEECIRAALIPDTDFRIFRKHI